MSNEIETDQVESMSMVWQLGSSPDIIALNQVDELKTMYLVGSDMLPDQLKKMLYRSIRYGVVFRGMSFDEACMHYIPKLFDAINGRGQNMIVKAELALKGAATPMEAPPEKPNIIQRVFGTEEAKEYARYKERKELGIE